MSADQEASINYLTMYLAGGACEDFYPWDLVLEEGFSRLYRGELTVLSKTKHNMEDLSGLLDRGISLTLSQRIGGNTDVLRTRYFHGIVTGVRSAGIFISSQTGISSCFSYVLTIEPELARLQFTRLTAPYYRMNPPDIFAAILAKYNIGAVIDQRYISKAFYGSHLLFDQSETSDLDFIQSIAALYGISYTFAHPAVEAATLGAPALYFSDGFLFPLSALAYSGEREEPATVSFDFLGAKESESVWKMETWNMAKTIGIDGVALKALYPNANYSSDSWKMGKTAAGDRSVTYNRLFHGYDRHALTGEVDADISLILEVRQMVALQAKTRWTCGAGNLALRPALILELEHFYGSTDNEIITALVTGIRLHHRVLWPSDLAVRPEGSEAGEVTEVTADCIDWGAAAAKWYCPEE
jgi:uncharacterized protein involved in type VI secretion and phage assembly